MSNADNSEAPDRKAPFLDAPRGGKSAIPAIIGEFVARIRAIRLCATEHIAFALESDESFRKELCDQTTTDDSGQMTIVVKSREHLSEVLSRLHGPHSKILAQSLLIFGFSTFDAYLGLLLQELYREVPRLIFRIEQKEVKISDLLTCGDLEEAIGRIIEKDIAGLLRTSYEKQFSTLANRHGVSTLTKFEAWPAFVEAAQRRNLITHCNGVVNAEYVSACEAAECSVDNRIGDTLTVDDDYLRKVLDLLYEVGVMLGHTLWRTADPARIEESERLLTDEVYDLLRREEWRLSKVLGKFAITLPKPKRDLYMRICRVNYAQALKWSGDNAGAMGILDAVDWSGSIRDLRLGVEVLRDNYDDAVSLMKEIGKRGELVNRAAYREWPVFRRFRETDQFKLAYSEVYGAPFVGDLEKQSPIKADNEQQLPDQERVGRIPETGELPMSSSPLPDIEPDDESNGQPGDPGAE